METTEHGLIKPAATDFYNVEDFNANADVLEQHLNDTESHVNAAEIITITEATELAEIGTGDTNDTIWGKVKKAISSLIEHISTVATSSTSGHVKIGTGLKMESGAASVKLTDLFTVDDSTVAASAKTVKVLNTNLETLKSHIVVDTAYASFTNSYATIDTGIKNGLEYYADFRITAPATDVQIYSVYLDSTTGILKIEARNSNGVEITGQYWGRYLLIAN